MQLVEPLPVDVQLTSECPIDFGVIRFQPSELTKIAFVMVLARYLRFRSNYRTVTGLLAPFGLALVPIALILKQPDLGTALTFIPALFAMLFVAGARMAHLLSILALVLVARKATYPQALMKPYRKGER